MGGAHRSILAGASTTNVGVAGEAVSNLAFAPVDQAASGAGALYLTVGEATQHAVMDLVLSIPNDPAVVDFYPTPQRTIDTRAAGGYEAHAVITVDYGAGHAGQAVALNLTVDASSSAGWFSVYPCDAGWGGTSDLNVNGTRSTLVLVEADAAGKVCVFGSVDATGVIIDTAGFLKVDSLAAPTRILDTRDLGPARASNVPVTIDVGAAASGQIVVARVTATQTSGAGYVTAYPASTGDTGTSLLNPNGRDDVSGLMVLPADEHGRISLELRDVTSSHLVVDLAGTIDPDPLGVTSATGRRLVDTRQPVNVPADITWTSEPGIGDVTYRPSRPVPFWGGFVTVVSRLDAVPESCHLSVAWGLADPTRFPSPNENTWPHKTFELPPCPFP